MPRRPPKQFWEHCVAGVKESGSAIDPASVCGALWHHKMTERAKHERVALEEAGHHSSGPRRYRGPGGTTIELTHYPFGIGAWLVGKSGADRLPISIPRGVHSDTEALRHARAFLRHVRARSRPRKASAADRFAAETFRRARL